MRDAKTLGQLTRAGEAAIKLGEHRTFETAGNIIQRAFHRFFAYRQRGDVVIRQQNILRAQLETVQLRQRAIDRILSWRTLPGQL